MMYSRMTTTAQGYQVVQRIVSQLVLGSCAIAINMVNAQVIACSAMLASVVVALHRFCSVAAKVIVVSSILFVQRMKLRVFSKPLMHIFDACRFFALFAFNLWAGFVNKIVATFNTLAHGSNRYCALVFSQFSKVFNICFCAKYWATNGARFLRGGRRQVNLLALNAGFVFVRHSCSRQTVFAS